jgi:multiple sugar transport system permease protein
MVLLDIKKLSVKSEKSVEKPFKPRLRYDRLFGLLLIAPWLVGFLLFKLLPILASLGISFTDFYMLAPDETQFIGLANYARLFQDRAVGYVLFASLGMALFTVPLQLGASILLASVLSSPRLKNKTLLRTLFFLPSIIPSVAVLFMWQGFIDPTTGWLNRLILAPLGLTGFDNVYTEGVRGLLMAINSLWSIGPGMLIILASLQSLPKEIEESARIDGAGPLLRFFAITLPLISPAVFFSLVINLVAAFGGVILLDRGNVFSGSNSPYDALVSEVMFGDFELGYASSLAWLFFLVVMVVIIFLFATSRRWVYYPDQER